MQRQRGVCTGTQHARQDEMDMGPISCRARSSSTELCRKGISVKIVDAQNGCGDIPVVWGEEESKRNYSRSRMEERTNRPRLNRETEPTRLLGAERQRWLSFAMQPIVHTFFFLAPIIRASHSILSPFFFCSFISCILVHSFHIAIH